MPSLCTTFRKEAGVVWNRMRTAAVLGLSQSEETLTECALYNIAVAHEGTDIVIDLATKPAEAKHGADWEWWLVHGKKGLGFRVQAKRLFPEGRYANLLKSGKNYYQQLDKLVSVSTNEGLIPLYCFFNFAAQQGQFNGSKNSCAHSYHGPSFWGCSLAFPDAVKTAQSDQLTKLKSVMYPWHLLVCDSTKTDLVDAASSFLGRVGRSDEQIAPRTLPLRVARLIEMGDQRREMKNLPYLDDEYWSSPTDAPEDLSGVVVLCDRRDF